MSVARPSAGGCSASTTAATATRTSTTRCAGPVQRQPRRADRWVRTTCGYCSVGCGMLLGVRDGRAVAVAGDPTTR